MTDENVVTMRRMSRHGRRASNWASHSSSQGPVRQRRRFCFSFPLSLSLSFCNYRPERVFPAYLLRVMGEILSLFVIKDRMTDANVKRELPDKSLS